jgi:hypothetical protein
MGDLTFLTNPEAYLMPLSTSYLRDQYEKAFEERKVNGMTYYIEKPNLKNNQRKERYIATTTEIDRNSKLVPVENLARLTETDVWQRNLSDEDLIQINDAIIRIKISINKDNSDMEFARDVVLRDGASINVEYVPYVSENTEQITNDLDEDI